MQTAADLEPRPAERIYARVNAVKPASGKPAGNRRPTHPAGDELGPTKHPSLPLGDPHQLKRPGWVSGSGTVGGQFGNQSRMGVFASGIHART